MRAMPDPVTLDYPVKFGVPVTDVAEVTSSVNGPPP
jgi:hypothetical protein